MNDWLQWAMERDMCLGDDQAMAAGGGGLTSKSV